MRTYRTNRLARPQVLKHLLGAPPVRLARQCGYTLFELLVVIAVVGIIAAFALPAFNSFVASNRLSALSNLLIGSIRQAQLEGIRHNGSALSGQAQFCSNSAANNGTDPLGSACGSSSFGAVIVDQLSGSNHTYVTPQNKTSLPTNVLVGDGTGGTTAVAALRFGANGLASIPTSTGPYSGLVADVYTTSISINNHRCIYMATGNQLSTCIVTGSAGACPTPNEPTNCQQQFQQK